MTTTQAKKKIETAKKTGRARFYSETDRMTYDVWYDEETKQYSFTYRDGYEHKEVQAMGGISRLIHNGYQMVGQFSNEQGAKYRAEMYREQGFDAKIRKITDKQGVTKHLVYIKKEV